MKATIEDAHIFSLIKWEFLSRFDFHNDVFAERALIEEYPFMECLQAVCGYCHFHNFQCYDCCLFKKDICFGQKRLHFHMFYWIWYANPTKENAQAVYDGVLECADEWEKTE